MWIGLKLLNDCYGVSFGHSKRSREEERVVMQGNVMVDVWIGLTLLNDCYWVSFGHSKGLGKRRGT